MLKKSKELVIYKEKMWNMLKKSNQKYKTKQKYLKKNKIKEQLNNTYTIIM